VTRAAIFRGYIVWQRRPPILSEATLIEDASLAAAPVMLEQIMAGAAAISF
jgi:hypothetical protein